MVAVLVALPWSARGQDAAAGPVVVVTAQAGKTVVRPGDQFPIAVVFDHAEGWHVHPNRPVVPESWEDFKPNPTTIVPGETTAARFGPVQWPKTKTAMVDFTGSGTPVAYEVYGGKAVAYVPVEIDPRALAGEVTLTFEVNYQACDDRVCELPETVVLTVPVTVSATASEPVRSEADAALFADFDTSAFARIGLAGAEASATRGNVEFQLFGTRFVVDSGGLIGLVLLLLLAMLGGFLLNLTPCVLPVIPIKILSLSGAAADPKRAALLGVVMSLGVVAFWLAIALAIVFISGFKAINQLFQTPWFSLGVGAFIAFMAAGMLGLFAVRLPQAVYMLDPQKESIPGSFLFGVLTAVLSTPCTAPFMGSAAAWATTQAAWITLATFASIGVGMALPYIVLSLKPALVSKVPRSGPSSDLVKQVMGLLMVAVAVFFLGTGLDPLMREPIDPPLRAHWWVVAALVGIAAVWTVVRGLRIKLRRGWIGGLGVAGLLLSVGAFAFAYEQNKKGPIDWIAYTPDRFEKYRSEGNVVVVDFTAEWCLNCKALEAGVLHRPEVAGLLQSEGVVAMKVDLTGNNGPGQAKLKSLNWVGIPLLAVYGPGLDEPLKYDTYTAEVVKSAVEKARAPRSAAR